MERQRTVTAARKAGMFSAVNGKAGTRQSFNVCKLQLISIHKVGTTYFEYNNFHRDNSEDNRQCVSVRGTGECRGSSSQFISVASWWLVDEGYFSTHNSTPMYKAYYINKIYHPAPSHRKADLRARYDSTARTKLSVASVPLAASW